MLKYQKEIQSRMGKKLIFPPRRNGKECPIVHKSTDNKLSGTTIGEIFFNEFEKIQSAFNETVATKAKKKPDEI